MQDHHSLMALTLLSLLLPLSLSSPTMETQERETLFSVMESMSSDRDWRSSNPDPCEPGSSWPGIECKQGKDNYLHVSRLDFGPTPNPNCMRNASFPSLIFTLPFLQSLFFTDCFKDAKTSLSFPPLNLSSSSNSYSSLQQLSLRSNPSLTGSIPTEIQAFKSLQVLTLSQNRLAGKIPDSISSLSSLIHLDLSYNSLTGTVPAQIGRFSSLVVLDLSYNFLSGQIPKSMGDLAQLQKVDLSSNKLTGTIPESVRSLSNLSFLALSNNFITGPLPNGFYSLQNLEYFILDSNPMNISLPSRIGTLTKLQELRLSNSSYYGLIPQSFTYLTNLSTLCLENNKLAGEIPIGLSSLVKMYHLNLSRNYLNGTVPFGADFVKRLGRNLDLSGNTDLCINESDGYYASARVGVGTCDRTGMVEDSKSGGSSIRVLAFYRFGLFSYNLIGGICGFWGLYCCLV